MGTMQLLLNDVESQFGLSDAKAGSLLSSILGLIQDQKGGLSGFLDRFRNIGLSDTVSGWLSGRQQTPISPENVETALGSQAVNSIASRTGLSFSVVTAALGFMLPKLVRNLTPGGSIPSRLPAEAMSYLSGTESFATEGARDTVRAVEGSAHHWLWPLLACLGILLAILFWPRRPRFNIEDQVRMSSEKANAALNALKPGYSPGDLSSALNLEIINFPTGSAQIPGYSTVFLDRAAQVIKMTPPTMTILIAGNTDNVGDSASNMTLSQQRADAVRDYLIQRGVPAEEVTSTGNGDTRPVANNDPEEGRFRNRRIEFNVNNATPAALPQSTPQ